MSEQATLILPGQSAPQVFAHQKISQSDAMLLAAYKGFLKRHRLREALYCDECWDGSRADGCEAHVTETGDVLIRCRCKARTYTKPKA